MPHMLETLLGLMPSPAKQNKTRTRARCFKGQQDIRVMRGQVGTIVWVGLCRESYPGSCDSERRLDCINGDNTLTGCCHHSSFSKEIRYCYFQRELITLAPYQKSQMVRCPATIKYLPDGRDTKARQATFNPGGSMCPV